MDLGDLSSIQTLKDPYAVQLPPRGEQAAPQAEGTIIGDKEIRKAAQTLRKYKDGKTRLESRIVDNEKWYRLRHWDAIGRKADAGAPMPASAWLFNMLANKHADMMDNYPAPNVLPREQGDERDAKVLSAILPVAIERNNFENVYSDACWYKLKNGTSAYGVFWDAGAENGLGDVSIQKIDLLNLFWEQGIADLQDSRNLFIVSLVDNELLQEQHPAQANKLQGSRTIDIKEYMHDDAADTTDKSLVVDWYYKRQSVGGAGIVHFCKFCGDTLLYASENDPAYQERGYYDHGLYPVVLDVLFPIEGAAAGFGYIDIAKDPQLYIDKLDADILQNANLAGTPRWFIKDDSGLNEEEFADFSKSFVHVAGRLNDENIKQIRIDALPSYILQHQQAKIEELKETAGNRDFSQGGSSGGVTAASAIAALQEAGNKLSRDMLKGSYRAFTAVCNLTIELIRQFNDEKRCFRITGEDGGEQYIEYDNAGLRDQMLPPPYEGAQAGVRRPIFDISIKAQRSNPFNRLSQNELAKELYGAGFFDPTRADMALAALELMDFEGKNKTAESIRRNKTLYDIVMEQKQMLAKMAQVIEQTTGTQLMQGDSGSAAQAGGAAARKAPTASEGAGDANGRAAANAQGAQMQRIAGQSPA